MRRKQARLFLNRVTTDKLNQPDRRSATGIFHFLCSAPWMALICFNQACSLACAPSPLFLLSVHPVWFHNTKLSFSPFLFSCSHDTNACKFNNPHFWIAFLGCFAFGPLCLVVCCGPSNQCPTPVTGECSMPGACAARVLFSKLPKPERSSVSILISVLHSSFVKQRRGNTSDPSPHPAR